jgi:hypothetical protein
MIFEGLIQTRDGEREYQSIWYIAADTIDQAVQYFKDRVCEEAGGKFEDFGPYRKGYWDESGEVFLYVDHVSVCRGMVVPKIDGSSIYIDFDAENWRKKYQEYREREALEKLEQNLNAETDELVKGSV